MHVPTLNWMETSSYSCPKISPPKTRRSASPCLLAAQAMADRAGLKELRLKHWRTDQSQVGIRRHRKRFRNAAFLYPPRDGYFPVAGQAHQPQAYLFSDSALRLALSGMSIPRQSYTARRMQQQQRRYQAETLPRPAT